MVELNTVYNCDCIDLMSNIPDNFIDLTVTSPPYNNLRDYNKYKFNFSLISKELYRITKQGGVVVWVVGDQVINGSESLTSFKQAIDFVEKCGFKLHDTMFYEKRSLSYPDKNRYYQSIEYMFVLCKNKLKTFNPIEDVKNKYSGISRRGVPNERQKDGNLVKGKQVIIKKYSRRRNIWSYATGMTNSTADKIAFQHPAIFPEKLAEDHILSWSNEQDVVFDPFMGSGTVLKMAIKNKRKYLGAEISKEYCRIMTKRFKALIFTKQFKVIKL